MKIVSIRLLSILSLSTSLMMVLFLSPLRAQEKITQNQGDNLARSNPLIAQNVISITGVSINQTPEGLEVILETPSNSNLQPLIYPQENTLIIDIFDAVLTLPEGEEFKAENPTDDITEVKVTKLDDNSTRITITGKTNPPVAQIKEAENNLVLAITTAEKTTTEDNIEIVATQEQQEGSSYNALTSTTGTRIEAPLSDVPISVQVLTEEVIEDRQVVRLQELADNVPGVEVYSGYGGISSNDYYIRGFNAGESFRNGFRDFTFISPRDVANVERVEFLKGPASVLYGGGFNFSGAVNTITKRPQDRSFYDISVTIGNYDFYRTTLDFTGPITEDKNLLYRFNMAYENAGSFRDFNRSESFFVAPSITWQIGANTKLTVDFEYQNYDYVFDRGFFPSNIIFDLPISRSLFAEPNFSNANFNSYYFSYNFEHSFSEEWKIRQGFGGLIVNGGIDEVTLGNFSSPFVEADGRTLTRQGNQTDESQENYSLQTELIGEFKTDGLQHKLLFGVEYAYYKFAYDFYNASVDPIDIFQPVYGAKPGEFFPSFAQEYGTTNVGVYLQDLIYFTPNIIGLFGGRFDWNDSFYTDRFTGETFSNTFENNFSPRLGLVYKPLEDTSLYFSWSKSFIPTTFGGITRTGEAFEPETGEQFEIGVKQSFLDNKLSATLAFYHLTKQNVSTTDPIDPNFSIQTGEQTSKGIEFDLTGEILPGWNLIATYAYTDAYVSEDNNIPVGDRLTGIPYNTASLWTTYQIQSGDLEGLGFGLGLYYVGDREASLPNNGVKLPSYFRTDASIFYRRNSYEANLSFKNLFSEKIYNTQGFFITPAAPFTVLANFKVRF